MEFDAGAAILAGLIAGAVMSGILYMEIGMIRNQMSMNLFLLLGTMMVRDRSMAYIAVALMHGVMSIVFGLIHVALYNAFGLESGLAAWGIVFGLAHWLVVGMGLGMMPTMHPVVRRGQMQAPGAFAMSYPSMTVTGFFMLHIVFGVLMGATYGALL